MKDEDKKALTEDEFTRFGRALMQVSKDELADVMASDERDKADLPHEKRRSRPRKTQD